MTSLQGGGLTWRIWAHSALNLLALSIVAETCVIYALDMIGFSLVSMPRRASQ